jgi:hypothetical protein
VAELLNDPQVRVRLAAAGSLLRMGVPPTRVIPTLIAVLWSGEPSERHFALVLLANTDKDAAAAERVLELVQRFDADEDVRSLAGDLLDTLRKRTTQ